MLSKLITPANIKVDLESTDKEEVFEELLEVIVAAQPGINRQEALKALTIREEKMCTGIIPGIAVPHAVCSSVHGAVAAVGLSRDGIEYASLDGTPVNFIIMLLFAQGDTESHLQTMKDVASVLQHPDFMKVIMEKKTPQEVYDALYNFETEPQE
ncbi:MAG TPA: PTS sugar transporter subunit IIA [Treponema sp.]|nr:PTS sugar transporter subunit IIA [Treponema sp.]